MRADYGLYIVAIICFIVAGLVLLEVIPSLPKPATFEATAMTVIFTAAGLIFVILGYALRPKPIISIPEPSKPALTPSPQSTLPSTEETTATPLTLPQEETAKPERKKPKAKTRRKRTKRRRKKA